MSACVYVTVPMLCSFEMIWRSDVLLNLTFFVFRYSMFTETDKSTLTILNVGTKDEGMQKMYIMYIWL